MHKHKQQTEIKGKARELQIMSQRNLREQKNKFCLKLTAEASRLNPTAMSAPQELSEYQVVKFWGFWAPSLPLPWTVGCVRLMNTKSLIWIDRSPTESDKNIHFPTKFRTSQRCRSSTRKDGGRKVVGIKFPLNLM